MLGKEQELEIRKETKLGQKTQQIVCKRMIQAALIWICSLAKTQRRSSSLSVSGDDKRRRGRVTGRLQLQHLGNAAGPGAPGPLPPQLITAKKDCLLFCSFYSTAREEGGGGRGKIACGHIWGRSSPARTAGQCLAGGFVGKGRSCPWVGWGKGKGERKNTQKSTASWNCPCRCCQSQGWHKPNRAG